MRGQTGEIHKLAWLAAWAVLLVAAAVGAYRPLDELIRDQRFSASTRTASGDIVFVDIDSRSLQAVGVWPWPRHLHAELLDKIIGLGADEVILDVDFSTPSVPAEDAALERA